MDRRAAADLLREVGVRAARISSCGRSADGFTVGTPVAALIDGRDAMLAVAMNGQPFPSRTASRCGWSCRVSTAMSRPRNGSSTWSSRRSPRTTRTGSSVAGRSRHRSRSSRGSTCRAADRARRRPHRWRRVGPGRRDRRGRGPGRRGAWLPAELAPQDEIDTWRQWRLAWNAPSGDHQIAVRATNRDGETQTSALAPPAPNGATGYHTIQVSVR